MSDGPKTHEMTVTKVEQQEGGRQVLHGYLGIAYQNYVVVAPPGWIIKAGDRIAYTHESFNLGRFHHVIPKLPVRKCEE